MPGPLRDRRTLLRAVRANLSCVHFVYGAKAGTPDHGGAGAAVRAAFEQAESGPATAEATDDEGTRHRLWVCTDAADICVSLSDAPLMIADGHHRYAAALAHRDGMRKTSGSGPWDAVMGLLVDASTEDPPVLPIHRVVQPGAFDAHRTGALRGERVKDLEEVLRSLTDDPATAGVAAIESGEVVHRVVPLDGPRPAVRALHDGPLRGFDADRLRYVSDAASAEQMVRSGHADAAFFLPPTRIDAVRSVLDAGGTLPEKSTYFWPKPRTGMVIRPFDI
jgi:uncharacterized protein (DUF1015 family)